MALTERLSMIINADGSQAMSEFKKVGQTAERELGKAEGGARKMGSQMQVVGAAMVGVGGLIVGTMSNLAGSFVDAGKETLKLQRMTGDSAESMSQMRYAAKMSGVDVDGLAKGYSMLSKNMAAGKPAFDTLGVATKDANGNLRSVNAVLLEVADKFKTMTNVTERNALASQIFGRSYADLLPLLNKGGTEIQRLAAEADKYGLTLTGDNLAAVKDYIRNQRELGATFEGLKVQIGGGVVGALNTLTGPLKSAVGGFQALNPEVRSTVGAIGMFGGTALIAAGAGITLVGTVMKAKTVMDDAAAAGGKMATATKGLAAASIGVAGLTAVYAAWSAAAADADAQAAKLGERIEANFSQDTFSGAQARIGRLTDQINGLKKQYDEWAQAAFGSKNPIENLGALWNEQEIENAGRLSQELIRQREAAIALTDAAAAKAKADGISIDKAWQMVTAENEVKKLREANPKLTEDEARGIVGLTDKTKALNAALDTEKDLRKEILSWQSKQYAAITGLGGASLDYEAAQREVNNAAQEYAKTNSAEDRAKLERAIYAQAQSLTNLKQKQAEASGAKLSDAEASKIQADEITRLSDRFPGLQQELAGTILLLQDFAAKANVTINVDTASIDEAQQKLYNALYLQEILRKEQGGMSTEEAFATTELKTVPKFDDGGIVPGPIGMARLVLAHGGETIIPTHKATANLPGGSRTITVNNNVTGMTADQAAQLIAVRERQALTGIYN